MKYYHNYDLRKGKPLLNRQKPFYTILLLLLFSSLISSETRISEISNIRINPSENIIPMDGGSLLKWNNKSVSINGVYTFESGNETIINVIINSQKTKPNAVIILEDSQNTQNYSFRLLEEGQLSLLHSLEKEYDEALPKLLFAQSNLLMLKPETQHVTLFDSNDLLTREFNLFENNSWSHEKKLLIADDKYNQSFLLGMESANLTKNHNVSLFSLLDKPELQATIPLSMPYFFTISNSNTYAIVGTNKASNTNVQTPVLILLDQNYKLLYKPIELKKLPRKITWLNDELILIYKDKLLIYNTVNQVSNYKIKFDQKIFPLDIFKLNESIFVVVTHNIGTSNNGNFYQTIDLMEYNYSSGSVEIHPLQEGIFNSVNYFPFSSNTFYLQLDNHLIQYEISK